jgi:hypothetical protein
MALSLTDDLEAIHIVLLNALQKEVIEDLKPKVIEEMKAAWRGRQDIQTAAVDDAVSDAFMQAKKALSRKLNDKINRAVSKRIDNEVEIACQEYMGSQNESFAKIILRRIDLLVAEHLKIQLASNKRAQEYLKDGEFKKMAAEYDAQLRSSEVKPDERGYRQGDGERAGDGACQHQG